jgi:hypothetical protein
VWDFYNIHEVESGIQTTAHLGSRLANRTNAYGYTNKWTLLGPTPLMLEKYYKLIFYMYGTLADVAAFGPVTDGGWDDVTLISNWLATTDGSYTRGFWVMGLGFVEGVNLAATTDDNGQANFMANVLGVQLRDPSYFTLAGTNEPFPDLLPGSVIAPGGEIFAAWNSCQWALDVLDVFAGVGTVAGYYQNIGVNGPYVSSVLAPKVTPQHPYITLVEGFPQTYLSSRYGTSTVGRHNYLAKVLVNVFGSVCSLNPSPSSVDVPQNTARTIDFLGNVWGNPMVAGGKATVHFGLAKSDRVEVKVYDVTGRLVRTLADRSFQAGEHSLTWDGTNDQGQVVARGVYFTQVKYLNSRFVDAKKLTVLK